MFEFFTYGFLVFTIPSTYFMAALGLAEDKNKNFWRKFLTGVMIVYSLSTIIVFISGLNFAIKFSENPLEMIDNFEQHGVWPVPTYLLIFVKIYIAVVFFVYLTMLMMFTASIFMFRMYQKEKFDKVEMRSKLLVLHIFSISVQIIFIAIPLFFTLNFISYNDCSNKVKDELRLPRLNSIFTCIGTLDQLTSLFISYLHMWASDLPMPDMVDSMKDLVPKSQQLES